MPPLATHAATKRTKLLIVGDPGSGKTALLGSLANAGYNVRILDFDAGVDILFAYVKPDCAQPRTKLEVLVLNETRQARVLGEPAYDPANERPRA